MNATSDPFAAARTIADAVLYEGYLLFPYTASARKNQIRWQFGVVVPRAYEAAGTGEHAEQQTEVLLEADAAPAVDVLIRFLRLEARSVEAAVDGAFVPVSELVVDGVRHLTFEEGIACDVTCSVDANGANPVSVPLDFVAVREIEPLYDAGGTLVARIVRERAALTGRLTLRCELVAGIPRLFRVKARIENHSAIVPALERAGALRTAFVSTHALLAARTGRFISTIDPPAALEALSATLDNRYVWPALVGDATRDAQRAGVVLAAPIVVGDFPQIAPQTDTDAFDGTEIDELLTLGVYALSDVERAEARATDPRARALVDRAERFDDEAFARLHAGTFVQTESERRAPDYVIVDGRRVAKGSSVRLAPKRNADAWDMFLDGKVATVRGIQQDFEDRTYVTVTIDDDPASEYHQWYGRSFFFDTDEVEPLGGNTMSARVLVAGVGNIFFGDDGFGTAVLACLAGDWAPDVRIEDYGIRGMHLAFEMLTGYTRVIVVDAVSQGGAPGTLSVIVPDVHAPGPPPDAHRMDMQNVFAFIRTLGGEPPPVEIIGCEPLTLDEGIELSAVVAAAVEPAAALVRKRISLALSTAPCEPGEATWSEV